MSEQNYLAFWNEALKQIHEEYKEKNLEEEFRLWFNMEYENDKMNVITVSVPSKFMWTSMVQKGYIKAVESKINELCGQKISLEYIVKNRPQEEIPEEGEKNEKDKDEEDTKKINIKDEEKKIKYHPQLREDFTFERFVKGEKSEFAYSASLAVAKKPGRKFNPLLIFGGVGLGKTHLMQSIGNYIYNNPPEEKKNINICYITAENFTNEFTFSIRDNSVDKFKNKYRKCDVLLLDDIHFLQEKLGIQEELFYTFEELYKNHSQMVFTCDRPISELKGFSERLISRFKMSSMADLQFPSYEERKAIILKKLEIKQKEISEDVIDFVAQNIQSNIRDLCSCIDNIIGYSEIVDKIPNIEMAKTIIKNITSETFSDLIPIKIIQKVVADHYNISLNEIKGTKRNKKITYSRHIAIYISRKLTESSFGEIGNEFGGKDHSTIMHSFNIIEDRLKTDENLSSTIKLLIKEIKEYKQTNN